MSSFTISRRYIAIDAGRYQAGGSVKGFPALNLMSYIENNKGLAQLSPVDFSMVISSGKGNEAKMISITKRQWIFLRNLLDTGDVTASAEKAGVSQPTIASWFRQSRFRQFIKERMEYAANKNGMTFDWAMSELKDLWEGKSKKNKVQMEAMKEINRAMGHIKSLEGAHVREFINAEYVVIQKGNTFTTESNSAPRAVEGRGVQSPFHLPDVRQTMGQIPASGLPEVQGDVQTVFDSVVHEQPVEARQGNNLEQAPTDHRAMPEPISPQGNGT